MTISVAHRAVRNAASIALADAVAGASSGRFYAAQGGALLGQRTLATPCGSINTEGRIVLIAAAAQDLVQVSGAATWAAWCDGAGTPIFWGLVTDEAGAGPFKLRGTSGTMLYAGGAVLLTGALLG